MTNNIPMAKMLLFNGARESPLCKLHFASLFSILINFWWLDESKCIVIHPPAQDLKPLIPFVWGGSLVYPTYVRNVPILVPFHLTEVTRSHCITFRYWRTNLVILSSWMMKPLNIALDTSDEHFTRPPAYYKRSSSVFRWTTWIHGNDIWIWHIPQLFCLSI